MKMTPKMKMTQKHLFLAKNTYFKAIFTILDFLTTFWLGRALLETDYSMGNEDLATQKKKFFKIGKKIFFFKKKSKKT